MKYRKNFINWNQNPNDPVFPYVFGSSEWKYKEYGGTVTAITTVDKV